MLSSLATAFFSLGVVGEPADVVFHYLFGLVFWNFGWRATQGRFLVALGIVDFFVGFLFDIGKST
jgi:hypothetical protein